jgi:NAD-dependent SIR2 family protein deacetylase
MMQNIIFAHDYAKLEECNKLEQGLPFLMKRYFETDMPERLRSAYANLYCLLEGKNYFIVSMSLDSYLMQLRFQEDNIVNPCGNFRYLQCDKGCQDKVFLFEEHFTNIEEILNELIANKQSNLSKCDVCGGELVFNNIYAQKYLEIGYTQQWEVYMKWLQKTVNRKLVLLELGVGMQFPTVIRWPFEKTAMYNQKSVLFRIHEKLSMLTADIAKRGYSCPQNAVKVLECCAIENTGQADN